MSEITPLRIPTTSRTAPVLLWASSRVGRSPEELAKRVRQTEDETAVKEFEVELSKITSDLLASANSRDANKVQERLDDIKSALEGPLQNSIDTLFGDQSRSEPTWMA